MLIYIHWGFGMERSKLLELRNIIDDIKNNGFNTKYISYIHDLINEENIPFKFILTGKKAAAFDPITGYIYFNVHRLNAWVDEMLDYFRDNWGVYDRNLLRGYLVVYLYAHEYEHVNQYLIGFKNKDTDYDFKKYVFSDIYRTFLPNDGLIPNHFAYSLDRFRYENYKNHAYEYILERNAPIEGYDFSSKIALESNDKDVYNIMIDLRNYYLLLGYLDDNRGCLFHTYRNLGLMPLYDRLNIPKDIPFDTKVREGLVLSNAERNILLTKVKSETHCK